MAPRLPLHQFIDEHWGAVSACLQAYVAVYASYVAANAAGALQTRRYRGVVWRTSAERLPMLRILLVALLVATAVGAATLWLAERAAEQEAPSSSALRLLLYACLGGSLGAAMPLAVLAAVQALTLFNLLARSRGREEKFCFLFHLWLEPEFAVMLQASAFIGFVVALTMCGVAHFSATAHHNSY